MQSTLFLVFMFKYSLLVTHYICYKTKIVLALAGVAQWIECRPVNQGFAVQFPVWAHAWVAGKVPSRGM